MAGNINLIDPNNVNINTGIVNGIPQYQDMYIFAELIAVRRGRTVLETTIGTDLTRFQQTGLDKTKTISLLGENQDSENGAHNGKFTTNWYDGATERDKTYEGFGMNNVNIIVNSSFIPQINIEFIDIRGLAFFNRDNSPYRLLFDFPPPIFYLTVKGYYGKAITYQMHLVKYTTAFKPETGNYHIDCQFIAITYAPLTDILFRYVVQAPLMGKDKEQPLSSDPKERPKNTFDLILKLEQVYAAIPDKLKTDSDNKRYDDAKKKLGEYTQLLDSLYGFKRNDVFTIKDDNLKKNTGEPILFTYNKTPDSDSKFDLDIISTFSSYISYLKTFETRDIPKYVDKRLYIGYTVDVVNGDISLTNQRNTLIKRTLDNYKEFVITQTNKILSNIDINDIGDAENIKDQKTAEINDEGFYVRYIGIDITDYFVKLYKGKFELEEEKNEAMNDLNDKINNMIQERLGMLPTIYNIFEILLNDVDEFFRILRNTANDAEEHHDKYSNLIVNDGTYKDVERHIYPFPLIVKSETMCNQKKEVRSAPIEISRRLDEPFPELVFVQEFINSFLKYNRIYKQATLKEETNKNGDYKWIPFTPADSVLISPNIHSPYFGTDSGGGGTTQQPINVFENNKLANIFNVLLKRFYVLSQNAFAYSFYGVEDDIYSNISFYDNENRGDRAESYVKLYAQTEALNLVNSITNEEYGRLLLNFSDSNKSAAGLKSQSGFYSYLNKFNKDLYSNDEETSFEISNGDDFYRDKLNDDYRTITILPKNDIVERTGAQGTDDLGKFVEENKTGWARTFFLGESKTPEETFAFTQENVILRKDTVSPNEGKDPNKYTPLKTKFLSYRFLAKYALSNQVRFMFTTISEKGNIAESIYNDDNEQVATTESQFGLTEAVYDYDYLVNNLSNEGNQFFVGKLNPFDKLNVKEKNNVSILDTWVDTLSYIDTQIYDDVIRYENGRVADPELTQLLYLSSFGYALSPFNYYPFNLNNDFFTTPSIIELPTYVCAYIGLLVGIEKNDSLWQRIYNFFVNGSGRLLLSGGIFIFADIHDINTYLSDDDKVQFRSFYDNWVRDFDRLALRVDQLYNAANTAFDEECTSSRLRKQIRCKKNIYERLMDANADVDDDVDNTGLREYNDILDGLVERVGLTVYNEITFRFRNSLSPVTYTSLETTNSDTEVISGEHNRSYYNDLFFTTFFREVNNRMKNKITELDKEKKDFEESTGDVDILTQTYYSFKNINDKWIAGLTNKNEGYPFKNDSDKNGLISQFAFVDRAMNPIGDTIIDPKILIDAKDSPDTSVFTVISQLLSLNGFEFFPLQNFLKFNENEWEDSFKIQTDIIQTEYPVFVCMYIGGASSYPTGIELFDVFKDDGIVSLETPEVSDFFAADCIGDPDKDNQVNVLTKGGEFLNEVRAFKVRYGEQNQNMFFDFAVDSKEYPETNESIQILSRLAGDEKENAPVPKAQNLYNLYENRAYKATIGGLGNMMIQPTQYFQLENVPLFNGAYVILTVEHNITPNKMTTKFSGTKLLKYPIPRVTNPASIIGFEGGSTTDTNVEAATSTSQAATNEVTLGVGTASNPSETKYNSMYTFEIG